MLSTSTVRSRFPAAGSEKNSERGKERDRRSHMFCRICNNTDNDNDNDDDNNMRTIYDEIYIRGDRRTYRTLHFRGWIRAAAQTAAERRKGFPFEDKSGADEATLRKWFFGFSTRRHIMPSSRGAGDF